MENGISTYDTSALCPAAAGDRTINSLEAGPEGSKVVFLLSADHASSTLNVLSLSFQKHLHSRFYVEGHRSLACCTELPRSTSGHVVVKRRGAMCTRLFPSPPAPPGC